jgi:hypothetical protein
LWWTDFLRYSPVFDNVIFLFFTKTINHRLSYFLKS